MKNKKWILPVSIVVGVILVLLSITLIAFGGIVSAKGYSVSRGRLYFADNGTYLINGDASMLVNDCSDDARLFEGYQNGDRVILLHGAVDDSFPAITDGYRVFRTLKGDGTYKPEDEMIGVATIIGESEHTHETASDEQTVSNPISGYCGNTQTTIYFADGKSYTFMSGNSVTMTDILVNLKYDKNKLCKCLPEYTVDTEFGTGYGINLTGGYARCDKGQADLTQVQIDKLKEIILWAKEAEAGSTNTSRPDYSFSFTWNTYGISSYDSESGTLIKTKDATNPKDFTTTLKLTEQQYSAIWELIESLDIESYPDKYNPHKNGVSTPYMTLILSVKSDDIDKTVTVEETILSYETDNSKGQKFLDVCKGIRDILTATDEWKALPEYEFLYD